ncbi:MAG: alpha/beta fold hydrolase [Gemmatimonadota bacterium]|nr:alpha/beta fold hydrolase [Gemmatimonadota bacterium]
MGVNLVFVHGFMSGPTTWTSLTDMLAGLDQVRKTVTTFTFKYSSPKLDLSPVDQIPALEEIAESLATFLGTLPESRRNNPTILVGHSQGGLVIQSLIAKLLTAGEARRLLHLAHCVLIATPTNGSAFLLRTRGVLARLLGDWNPQEKRLRPLDEYIGTLQRTIAKSVVYSNAVTDHELPVPFTAIYGVSDPIVQPQSARWVFPDTEAVPGNHFTVIKPDSTTAPLCVVLERVISRARAHLPPRHVPGTNDRGHSGQPCTPAGLPDPSCQRVHALPGRPQGRRRALALPV